MNGLQTQPLKSMPELENAHTLHGFLLGVLLGHVMQAEKQFRALVPEAEAITPFSHYGILVHILGGGTKQRTIQIQVMSHGSHGSMNITVIPPIGNGHPVINEGRRCAGRADLINDIWGLKYDPEMASVIADANVACCLMHNRDIDKNPYSDFMTDYINDMKECVRLAHEAGISDDKIILDPGVGFGKDYTQNLQVIKYLDRLSDMGYPVLLGTSRKSVVGLTLDLPKDERVEGTVATSVIGALNHCMFVRVHDVKENYRAVKMTEAIMNS